MNREILINEDFLKFGTFVNFDLNRITNISELKLYYEILEVFKELCDNPDIKDIKKIKELYMKYVKAMLKIGTNNPDFNRDYMDYKYGNCYAYALGVRCAAIFNQLYEKLKIEALSFNVGFTNADEYRAIASEKELLERFYTDCDNLKIKVFDSEIDDSIKHDGYKIAIYLGDEYDFWLDGYDFHFARQNIDGMWSEKCGYKGTVRIVDCVKQLPSYDLVKVVEVVKPIVR